MDSNFDTTDYLLQNEGNWLILIAFILLYFIDFIYFMYSSY